MYVYVEMSKAVEGRRVGEEGEEGGIGVGGPRPVLLYRGFDEVSETDNEANATFKILGGRLGAEKRRRGNRWRWSTWSSSYKEP